MRRTPWLLAGVWTACAIAGSDSPGVRFLNFTEAQEALTAFGRTDDTSAWDAWVRNQDRDVRARIERGVEDSISNLIAFGNSFTALPRLPSAESAVSASGELVEAARSRVRAAAAALAQPSTNERLIFARNYFAGRGVPHKEIEAVLEANLARFAVEQRGYQERLRSVPQGDPHAALVARATLFDQRGLSVDTSLLPNFAIEDTLRAMLRKGALASGRVHSIAVIGPGLDFADKREGYDFYPIQTIQPFAVMEAVARLGLGKLDDLQVVTFDLNPAVNAHLRRLAQRAGVGTPYVLQLPRNGAADWTPRAIAYWEHFGELIGSPVAPLAAPEGIKMRAVSVRSMYASRIEPLDLNVVGEILDARKFDLLVATNILVYYDRFQQALALAGIARMMNPGGVFLSNTVLPAERPADLEYLGRRSMSYSTGGSYGDDIVVYRRK
ncbi:MAG TPA: hypothetical protein VMR62_13625 [Bryobacteraceae bacterium]|jgi:hypothetical protein|nr:hypothetical protein [Bryobacteraceae bacterium]